MTTLATPGHGQTQTIDVDVQGRSVTLLDGRSFSWEFRNAPAFNLVRLTRPGQSAVGTTFQTAASTIGTTVRLLGQVLDAIWQDALRTQPGPGPGVPIDPGIPPAPPDPAPPRIDIPPPLFPGPGPLPPPGGGTRMEVQLSSLGTAIAVVIALATQVVRGPLTRGLILRWQSLPGWARTVLAAAGITAGTDIVFDMGPGDDGWIDVPFIDLPGLPPIGAGSGDPVTQMVEAMTVSTWDANGVQFHRLSDGRLAVRNKHGVWKIWRPKKPIVLMPTGASDLKDLLRADEIVQKQAEKIKKVLRNRGWKVSRT